MDRNSQCNCHIYSVTNKKPATLTFFDFSDMWTSFEILSRPSCSKLNLLSFDIGVVIDNSSKVKSYEQFFESSRYNLNACSCFRIKFSKYSISIQMTVVQVICHIVLILNINIKVIYLQYVMDAVSVKSVHPTLQKACERVPNKADTSIQSFGLKW